MDLWIMIQERFVILAVFTAVMLVSLFLWFSVWKNRADLSKSLVAVVIGLCVVMLILAIMAFIFTFSFGYNA